MPETLDLAVHALIMTSDVMGKSSEDILEVLP